MQIMPGKESDWLLDPNTMRMVQFVPHEVTLEPDETITAGRLAALLVRYAPDSIVEMGPELITIIERHDRAEFQAEHEVRIISSSLTGGVSKEELQKALVEAVKNIRTETKMRTLVSTLKANTVEMEAMVKDLASKQRYV